MGIMLGVEPGGWGQGQLMWETEDDDNDDGGKNQEFFTFL